MEVYLATLATCALSPLLRALIWRVPPKLLGAPVVLRVSLGAVFVTLVGGLLTQLLVGIVAADATLAPRVGAAVGASLGLLLTYASAQRSRTLRATLHLCQFLGVPRRQADAWRALEKLLDRARPAREERADAYAQLVLMATGPMTLAGYWEATFARLDALDTDGLAPKTVALRAQALATSALHLGRLETAREALDGVEGEVEDMATARWLEATEALLLVVMGNVEGALAHLDEEAAAEEPALAAAHRVVRAHAAACRGDDEGAHEELSRLMAEAGPLSLERALLPIGPATDVARAVLARYAADASGTTEAGDDPSDDEDQSG